MLDAILNRADTDTAYEAFVTLKASKEAGGKNNPTPFLSKKAARGPMPHFPPTPSNAPKRKRGGKKAADDDYDDDDYGDMDFDFDEKLDKKMRASAAGSEGSKPVVALSPLNGLSDFFSRGGEWDFLFPDANTNLAVAGPGPSSMAMGTGTGTGQDAVDSGGFPVRMGGGGPQIGSGLGGGGVAAPPPSVRTMAGSSASPAMPAVPPLTAAGTSGPGSSMNISSTPASSHDAHSPNADAEHQRTLRAAVAHLTNSVDTAPSPQIVTNPNNMTQAQVEERRRLQEQLRKSMEGEEATERKTEALQLITYHLNNFRINHEYKLPPSLMPTTVQRTMPHEHAIDGILFPSIRDRMILLRGRYDLVEAFHGYITEFTLHGDDALDHRNWEGSEKWLREFG